MVIAMDGATWDLARPWMQEGHMPNLARLASIGTVADMHAELPPSSVPNWPAFMTGKNAGKHGCVWWLRRDERGRLDRLPVDSRSVRGDTIWSYLSARGKRVIVQNVPVTYPVEPVNGVMISGLLTPRTAEDYIYPASLKPQLEAEVGKYKIYPEGGYGKGREQAFLESLIANIRHHAQAANFLLRNHPWDFFMLVLGPTDEGAHKYWRYLDPKHHLYRPQDAANFGDSIQQLYMAADAAIGELMRQVDDSDTVVVMSDHGFGPVDSFFLPNNWLQQCGYLKLKSSGATPFKRLLFQAGFTPRNIYPLGKQVLSMLGGARKLRQNIDPIKTGRSPLRRFFLSEDDIDWTGTSAYASGFLFSQIYINLIGREPQGIVTMEEYEPLRNRLIAELQELENPMTGELHYERIYKREALFSGPLLDAMPDLVCVPANMRSVDSGMDFRSNKLFETDSALSGTHRVEGIFAMRGLGVRKGARISPIRIYDFAPTIIHRLGLPVPDDLDGKVLTEALEADELASRPVESTPSRDGTSRNESGFAVEDEETIIERLRDLGYLS